MLVRKCSRFELRIKCIVVIDYIYVTVHQQIAVEIRAVGIVDQFVKPVYPRQRFLVDMRKLDGRIEYILAILDIQGSKDELIGFCHQIWNNCVLQPTPGVEITAIKAEYLKIRYRQTDFTSQASAYPFRNQGTETSVATLAPPDCAVLVLAKKWPGHPLLGNLQN